MIANYHTHTYRCKHAKGEDEEYCIKAIEQGLSILGYSDHTPYPYDEGFVSTIRMDMEQFDDYVESVESIRKKYADKIKVHLGIEVEYYPRFFDKLMNFVDGYPVEYMILGQHNVGDEMIGTYSGYATESEGLLEKYCKQAVEGFSSGRFIYFAHPDLIHFTGDGRKYDKWMSYLCRNAREYDIPLEINLQGIWLNRHYPNSNFWEIAGVEGNKVIIGSDAHDPEYVYCKTAYNKALELVKKNNLQLIDRLEL